MKEPIQHDTFRLALSYLPLCQIHRIGKINDYCKEIVQDWMLAYDNVLEDEADMGVSRSYNTWNFHFGDTLSRRTFDIANELTNGDMAFAMKCAKITEAQYPAVEIMIAGGIVARSLLLQNTAPLIAEGVVRKIGDIDLFCGLRTAKPKRQSICHLRSAWLFLGKLLTLSTQTQLKVADCYDETVGCVMTVSNEGKTPFQLIEASQQSGWTLEEILTRFDFVHTMVSVMTSGTLCGPHQAFASITDLTLIPNPYKNRFIRGRVTKAISLGFDPKYGFIKMEKPISEPRSAEREAAAKKLTEELIPSTWVQEGEALRKKHE